MSIKSIYILLCVIVISSACKPDNESVIGEFAYLGGEIVNPNSDYIVLYKYRSPIDTIFLDRNNRFSYKLVDFTPGLYNFYDGKEAQTMLIHNRDSLLLRLNTMDFDETLTYTGIGAKENNYLINLFLVNEIEERNVLKSCKLNPIEFENKYKAIRDEKLKKLKKFQTKNKTSKLFNQIAKSNINYAYYSPKERYPLANDRKSDKEIFKSLPEHFYDYRKDIDYNSELLHDYGVYYNFLRLHFNNLALEEHFKHSEDNEYDDLSVDYNLDKMKLIDEKVNHENIKNRLLNNVIRHFLSVSKKTEDYDEMLQSFKSKSTNKNHINQVIRIVDSYKKLKPGQEIPEIRLYNKNDQNIYLKSLIKKPTVIYFWTKKNKNSMIESNKRVKELNAKYPEVHFVSINLDNITYKEQVTTLNRYDLRVQNEYRFVSPSQSKETLSIKPINKVFLLDAKGKIINAKANMFNIRFEQELLGAINN